METNRRRLLRGLGTGGAAALLAGCIDDSSGGSGDGSSGDGNGGDGSTANESVDDGSADDEEPRVSPTRAELWHQLRDGEKATFEEHVDAFESESEAELRINESGNLRKVVENALEAGEGPEMYRWAQDWVVDHWKREFLYDAADELSVDPASTFDSAAVDAITVEGGDAVVGLPVAGETVALLYNEELVDAPPETFAEMEQIMARHYDPYSGRYGIAHPMTPYFASAWLHAFGGYYFRTDENGEGATGMDLDETKEGMAFVRDKIWPYMPETTTYEPHLNVFQNGNAPFMVTGPWAIEKIEDAGVDVGVASLPAVEGTAPRPYTSTSMWYFSSRMGEDDGRRRAALDYAEWIATNEDAQLTMAERHSAVPVLSSIGDDELPADVAGFRSSYDGGIAVPSHPKMADVWKPVEEEINNVLLDRADVDSRFDRAAREIRDSWAE